MSIPNLNYVNSTKNAKANQSNIGKNIFQECTYWGNTELRTNQYLSDFGTGKIS